MKPSRRDVVLASAAAAACAGTPDMRRAVPPAALPRRLPPYHENPVYHRVPPAAPIHLSSSVVLPSGSVSEPAPAAYLNPMGKDMELLEVKFEVSGPLMNNTFGVFGGTVSCELVLGEIKITNGAVPIWCFGRAENLDGEMALDFSSFPNPLVRRTYASFSWRLPRPLFIPAGASLKPKLTHTKYIRDTLNVRVGYSARTVSRQPKKVCVPYVSHYMSRVFNPISEPSRDQSTELQLLNDNAEFLNLQRLTGRLLYLNSEGAGFENDLDPAMVDFGARALGVRITDSYGRPVVRNYTPFRSVFSAATRSWELDNGAQMDPFSAYRVLLQSGGVSIEGAELISGQAFVSMVGWREVDP